MRLLRTGYGLHLLDFRILGPLEVVDDDRPVRLGGPKQRAVLAILLLDVNRVVPIERLVDDLYREAPPASALTQIQAQISQLRRLFGGADSPIETRAPGYLIRLTPEQFDLRRFERSIDDAGELRSSGDLSTAVRRYREALDLWRGPALADFAGHPFAQPAIARLEDLRLSIIEERIEVELALGRQLQVVSELEELVSEHPFRERLHGQLMLALYRSERQADALEVYRRLRRRLVDDLGIEPGPALQMTERAILTQDPSLEVERRPMEAPPPERSILVVGSSDDRLETLATVGGPLAAQSQYALILGRPVEDESELAAAAAAANRLRRNLSVPARAAVFTTSNRPPDLVHLATSYDVALVLLDAPAGFAEERLPDELVAILSGSPADVAMLAGAELQLNSANEVFVPFGGSEHDWAALELAAWMGAAAAVTIRLVGTRAQPNSRRRDASRLLADASLAIQRLVDVDTEPLLTEPTEDALADAVAGAAAVVAGISPRWRRHGIGASRRALVNTGAPVLLVHHGPRPGGLAPRQSSTRFTWSLQG
jgi:DNA-binding SARP family transcriptional activator